MPGVDTNAQSVLDADLSLRGDYKGVSVCDNSVFPFSPSANPSLTLAALALRLSALLIKLPQVQPPAVRLVDIATGDSQGRVMDNGEDTPVLQVQIQDSGVPVRNTFWETGIEFDRVY